MGCTTSKVANEDTVRRCKERRRHMRDAVLSRHHLAAAHSDYLRSLRLTAEALSRFASFLSLSISAHTPPVLLPPPSTAPPPPPSTISTLTCTTVPSPLPPPLPPHFSPPSPSIASSKPFGPNKKTMKTKGTFAYAPTPSQSSSAWNWEDFYPPSPPGSDFFDRLPQHNKDRLAHNLVEEDDGDEAEEEDGDDRHHLPKEAGSSESDVDDGRMGNKSHCDEWDDRYSRTSTSSAGEDGDQDESRSELTAPPRSNYESSAAGSVDFERRLLNLRHPPPSVFRASSMERPGRMDDWRVEGGDEVSIAPSTTTSLMVVVQHRDLKEIVATIEEYFFKAAAGGSDLSDLLETGRAQLDRSFRQLKKKLYHSNSVLSTLSSTWTSRPPLAVRYQLDTAALELEDSGGRKSHCSTLERLFAWEKKLYEEVKAREGAKIEHEKKLSTLQSLEYKGRDIAKLAKTKAAIQKLQSLILVTSQAVTTTSSAIIKLRDEELAPQLIELCYGILQMWRSMNQFHEVQNNIVQQVQGLVNHSVAAVESTDLHRQATHDLEASISDWHSSFIRLIKFQREYIHALYAWLKLTLFQVSNEQPERDHYSSLVSSELTAFCDEWKQVLDRLPDTVAAEAIKSFVKVINSISLKQTEELKIKKRVESYAKELEKKKMALRNVEKKFYQSYSMAGIGLPDGGFDGRGQVFDSRDPLMEKKAEVAACQRRVEEEMARHAMAIKVTNEMTMNNIQTGLPGVFQAMTGFSSVFAEALDDLCCRRTGPRR